MSGLEDIVKRTKGTPKAVKTAGKTIILTPLMISLWAANHEYNSLKHLIYHARGKPHVNEGTLLSMDYKATKNYNDRHSLLSHLNKLSEREAASVTGSINCHIAAFGLFLQQAYLHNMMAYDDFWTGHVGDFGLSGTLTSLGILLTSGRSRLEQFIGAAAFPALLTIKEYMPFLTSNPDNYDPVAYFAAASITYGFVKLAPAENRARLGELFGRAVNRISNSANGARKFMEEMAGYYTER